MPPKTGQSFMRVVFLCLKHYLINVNTNVSNARMNIPNAIRSLKSNGFLSISTTPILCRIEVSHPVTRLFSQTVYHDFYLLTILFSVIFIIYHCYFFINSTQNTFYHLKISYVYFFYCLIIYYLTIFFLSFLHHSW